MPREPFSRRGFSPHRAGPQPRPAATIARVRIPDPSLRDCLEPLTTEWRSDPPLRDAAVLAPIFTDQGEDRLLFTRRRDDLPDHPGEVCFPGGARDGDEDALACALRESREEIGLDANAVEVFGRLPERRSVAGFQVHTFVGRVSSVRDLAIDPREVQHILSIPVAELNRTDRWEWRDVDHPELRRRVPFFPHEGDLLWGLTARLTLDLLERLSGRRS